MTDAPDPGYLWNRHLGRVGPTLGVCEKCGRDLYREGGYWWADGQTLCPEGGNHLPAHIDGRDDAEV